METLDGEVVFGFVVAETNIHKKNLVGVSTCFLVLSAVKPFVEKLEVSSDESEVCHVTRLGHPVPDVAKELRNFIRVSHPSLSDSLVEHVT